MCAINKTAVRFWLTLMALAVLFTHRSPQCIFAQTLSGGAPTGLEIKSTPPLRVARLGDFGFRHQGVIAALAFGVNGKTLACACDAPSLVVWRAATQTKLWDVGKLQSPQLSLAYSPDDQMLVSGGADGIVSLWESSTGRSTGRIQSGGRALPSIAFSHDGHLLGAASDDGQVYVWKVSDRSKLFQFTVGRGVNSIAFSNDSKLLAAGGHN